MPLWLEGWRSALFYKKENADDGHRGPGGPRQNEKRRHEKTAGGVPIRGDADDDHEGTEANIQ